MQLKTLPDTTEKVLARWSSQQHSQSSGNGVKKSSPLVINPDQPAPNSSHSDPIG